ncbi:MAG: type II secretion system F family protein [Firmicutes bacterium]|nr:type II secretion system F family protein [Bacillota bacterium]
MKNRKSIFLWPCIFVYHLLRYAIMGFTTICYLVFLLFEFVFIKIPAYIWTGVMAFVLLIQIGIDSVKRLFRPYTKKREAKREEKAREAKREEKRLMEAAKSATVRKIESAKDELREQTLGKEASKKRKEKENAKNAGKGSLVERFQKMLDESTLLRSMRNQRNIKRQEMLIDYNGEDAVKSDVKIMYEYEARTPEGKVIKGYMDAFSKVEVHSFLLSEGYQVYSIKTSRWITLFHGSSGSASVKIKTKDLIFFLTQLSTYLKAGITLIDSLHILTRQYAKKKGYNKVFKEVLYDLSTGVEFSDALARQKKAFPKLLVNMVKSSEMTGELPEVLDDMAEYYTEIDRTRKQMITAMMYPAIVFILSVGVFTFMLLYIIPKFVEIYESMDASKIPGITLAIMAMSDFLKSYFVFILIALILFIVVFYLTYKNVQPFRKNVQRFVMHLPIFGNVVIYNEVTTFTKTLSSLMNHNVFITDSMEILERITDNEIYKELIQDTIDNLSRGEKISAAFAGHWAFPVPAYEMLVTGEKTGELPEMMQKVSSYYQELHKQAVTRIKTFIEPAMIIMLTGIVGIIILAIVVPMFSLYDTVM